MALKIRVHESNTTTKGKITFDYTAEDIIDGIRQLGWGSPDRYIFSKLLGIDEDTVRTVYNIARKKPGTAASNFIDEMGEEVLAAVEHIMQENGPALDELLDIVYTGMPGYKKALDELRNVKATSRIEELKSNGYTVDSWKDGEVTAILYAKESGKHHVYVEGVLDSKAATYQDALSRNFIGHYDSGLEVLFGYRCEGVKGALQRIKALSDRMGAVQYSDLREATEEEAADPSIHWEVRGAGKYSRFAVSVEDGLWRKLTAEEFYGKPVK